MKGNIREASFVVGKLGGKGNIIKKATADGLVCVEAEGKIHDLEHYTRRAAQVAYKRKDIKRTNYKILSYKIDMEKFSGQTLYEINPSDLT